MKSESRDHIFFFLILFEKIHTKFSFLFFVIPFFEKNVPTRSWRETRGGGGEGIFPHFDELQFGRRDQVLSLAWNNLLTLRERNLIARRNLLCNPLSTLRDIVPQPGSWLDSTPRFTLEMYSSISEILPARIRLIPFHRGIYYPTILDSIQLFRKIGFPLKNGPRLRWIDPSGRRSGEDSKIVFLRDSRRWLGKCKLELEVFEDFDPRYFLLLSSVFRKKFIIIM